VKEVPSQYDLSLGSDYPAPCFNPSHEGNKPMQKIVVENKGLANERKIRPEDRVSITVHMMAPTNGPFNCVNIHDHSNVQGIAKWNGTDFKRCHKTGKTSGGSWDGQRWDADLEAMKSCSLPSRLFRGAAKAVERASVQQQAKHKYEDRDTTGHAIPRNSDGHLVRVYQPALAG
jgi:hypothetical protein